MFGVHLTLVKYARLSAGLLAVAAGLLAGESGAPRSQARLLAGATVRQVARPTQCSTWNKAASLLYTQNYCTAKHCTANVTCLFHCPPRVLLSLSLGSLPPWLVPCLLFPWVVLARAFRCTGIQETAAGRLVAQVRAVITREMKSGAKIFFDIRIFCGRLFSSPKSAFFGRTRKRPRPPPASPPPRRLPCLPLRPPLHSTQPLPLHYVPSSY